MILEEILKILKKESDQKAYTVNNKSYTYKELYKYVCNLYNFLLEKNPEKKPIIVQGYKDIYMKATFLACSLAGMTYVPVDKNMPEDRKENIAEQINPGLIIGKDISKDEIEQIMLNKNEKDIDKIYMKPQDTYYIIFTSGSTGKPKGVEITYENLDSCVNWLRNIVKLKNGVVLNQANFSFDLSVADLYLSLITESEHYIIDNTSQFDFKNIYENLERSQANVMIATPSYLDLLLIDKQFNKTLLPKLNTILFCGEKLEKNTVSKIYERFENIEIINCYGPTECTFAVTNVRIDRNNIEEDISIGIPKEDVEIYIVDENSKNVPEGISGEILITGKSVAKGYVGNTKSKAFINFNGKRAYLTGDVGFYKNGKLYCEGRKDNQIKYKGYRIELEDIENNLKKFKYIENVVVLTKENQIGKVINLFAYVILKSNINKDTYEVEKDIKKILPIYMCPKVKIVKSFPLNLNGKCDKRRLMEE